MEVNTGVSVREVALVGDNGGVDTGCAARKSIPHWPHRPQAGAAVTCWGERTGP